MLKIPLYLTIYVYIYIGNLSEAYHAAGGELEEEAGGGGAEELSDDVEDAAEEGDVAAYEGAEGDGGVDVATGDVGSDGNGHEESEGVGNGGGDEAGGGARAVVSQLGEGHAWALAGEHENEGAYELGQGRLQVARLPELLVAPERDLVDRHGRKIKNVMILLATHYLLSRGLQYIVHGSSTTYTWENSESLCNRV